MARALRTALASLAVLCAAATAAAQQVQYPGNGHYYEVVSAPAISWTQARQQAEQQSFMGAQGHLATLADSAENDWVYGTLAGFDLDRFWVGAYQDMNDPGYAEPDGGWVWVTGEPWGYESWFPGEPNDYQNLEHFAAYDHGGPTWNDILDAWSLAAGYVIEYEPEPGVPFCAGDGSGATCPCGNSGAAGAGCANSSGAGAVLSAGGSAGVTADDLGFDAEQLLAFQPALLFAGENATGGGAGLPFGDGLRCAGGNVVRLGAVAPDAGGAAAWGPGLGALGGWAAGDVRRFQVWYRDPAGSPCGAGFNLSNGYEVSFLP